MAEQQSEQVANPVPTNETPAASEQEVQEPIQQEVVDNAEGAAEAESSGEEMSFQDYLLYSARYGENEGVQECLDQRVPIDHQNEDMGNAALHLASANGHGATVTFLLEQGAQINLKNKSKNTPLHWACLCGQLEIVKLLCEWFEKHPESPATQKADPNLKNSFGRVPFEEALQSGRQDIAEYLAPRTKLEDDRTYSVIPEAQIYQDEEDTEEEKKSQSDVRSVQSEEGIRGEDYQRATPAQQQAQATERREANREAAEEQKLDQLSQDIKEKMNMQDFEVKVTKSTPASDV